jgi:hypothetical protein
MTGVKFLLRARLESYDLTSEVYRIKELPSYSRGPVGISVRQQPIWLLFTGYAKIT